MGSKLELAPPEQKKQDLQKEELLDFLTRGINSVEDKYIKEVVDKLFHCGGFLFEFYQFVLQDSDFKALVCAGDENCSYQVGIYGKADPIVTLNIKDKEGKAIAHLTLSPAPNIRPDLWNRWENSSQPMTSEERSELLKKFAQANLDPKTTRSEAVTAMWKKLRGRSSTDLPGFLGNLRTMGRGWDDFIDARNSVIHPQSPPRDVVYGYVLPEEKENLLDEPYSDRPVLKSQVLRSTSMRDQDLYRIATCIEGVTGHQVITFRNMDFEMLPTKRGLEIFNRLKESIPVMISSLTEEELTTVFEGIGEEPQTWDFVDPHLIGGIRDGFLKPVYYVYPEEKTESKDEIDQEFTARTNGARKFRFLAQALAQKIRFGIRWPFIKEKSGALQQLAKLENKSVDEIVKKYSL